MSWDSRDPTTGQRWHLPLAPPARPTPWKGRRPPAHNHGIPKNGNLEVAQSGLDLRGALLPQRRAPRGLHRAFSRASLLRTPGLQGKPGGRTPAPTELLTSANPTGGWLCLQSPAAERPPWGPWSPRLAGRAVRERPPPPPLRKPGSGWNSLVPATPRRQPP